MISMEYIITFKNTNWAIKSEQYLLAEKLQVKVMPLPAQISAGCGICLRIPAAEMETALDILTARQVEGVGLYTRVEADRGYRYSEITQR
ncbi:Protein of unknown function [Desulfitobacterium chlororespirans DSM 11544]|uniref:Putative Se/S carrier protein-like domain-containing protein n=2 Tax=Desulfitobacterium chlororespirans TaxID=51616 RepID=A0A1M7TRU4_9FIRM|nr:Protein of unknown function [Desulfitobacterium chlororespirans DSM 11544]